MIDTPLYTSIRQIVAKHGLIVFSDLRLFYLLSDYSAFDKLSNDSLIVRELQKSGYGQYLLSSLEAKDALWKKGASCLIATFIKSHSFESSEVYFVADSMAYGIGLLTDYPVINTSNNDALIITDETIHERDKGVQSIGLWDRFVKWLNRIPKFWKYLLYGIGIIAGICIVAVIVYYLFILVVGLVFLGILGFKKVR